MSDVVLRARVLTPESPGRTRWLGDARVAIAGGRLAEVRPWTGGRCDEDVRHGVLTPGFVDAHVHVGQLRAVGAASGPLLDWLDRSVFPAEARLADPAHAADVAAAFAAALAAAGTTLSLVYGTVHPGFTETVLGALDARGLKAIVGPVLMDLPSLHGLRLDADAALDALDALADRWHGRDGRFRIAVIPRFALSCTPALLARAGALAGERGLVVSTHLAEHPAECEEVERRFGRSYVDVYDDAGLLVPGAVLAHCVHLDERSWNRLAAARAVVAHCPDSNAFLGSGDLDTPAVLDRGIPLALGTDVAAGRTFRVPRVAALAHDTALRRGRRVPPETWLWAATRGGALALGHVDTGTIEPGLDADLVLHDVPAWVDDADAALAWILFAADAPWPLVTWVRGREAWRRQGGGWPWAAGP